ncbi:MAG: hypothetical protein LBN38_00980 [Verrucomicrobiota bacterium]|jgi:Flp pilus assembly protein TadD|nr:hypothetical protein [Verrucomicrobiota bacterium]
MVCVAPAQTWLAAPLPADALRLNTEAAAAATPAQAIRLYAQALRAAASNGPALFGLGILLLEEDQPEKALTPFRRLNALYPDDPWALTALATAIGRLPELRRADLQEALGVAERATLLAPEDAEAQHILSLLRHMNGEYAAAEQSARQAVVLAMAQTNESLGVYQQQEATCRDALAVFSLLE